jgi:hypothetical protein
MWGQMFRTFTSTFAVKVSEFPGKQTYWEKKTNQPTQTKNKQSKE